MDRGGWELVVTVGCVGDGGVQVMWRLGRAPNARQAPRLGREFDASRRDLSTNRHVDLALDHLHADIYAQEVLSVLSEQWIGLLLASPCWIGMATLHEPGFASELGHHQVCSVWNTRGCQTSDHMDHELR